MSDLAHDPKAAIEFLQRFHPGRGWNLTAIPPDNPKGIEGRTFGAGQDAELAIWVGIHAQHNLYYGVPELPASFDKKKASKDDVVRVHYLHVDVDPRVPPLVEGETPEQNRTRLEAFNASERERILNALRSYQPPPTVIVGSGGGFQAFWLLAQPVEVAGNPAEWERVERYNRAIELALEGDHCHSIDHVMRLPGSINWPNARKRKKGRVPARASVVGWHPERAYELGSFQPAPPKGSSRRDEGPEEPVQPRTVASLDDLTLEPRIREIILTGRCAAEGPKKRDDSRSAWLFDAACGMVRSGLDRETVVGILLDPRYRISESVLDKGRRSKQYAVDQYKRALEKKNGLKSGDDGKVGDTVDNIRKSVSMLGASLEFDEFSGRVLISGLHGFGPSLDDAATNRMRLLAESQQSLKVAKERYADVVLDLARDHPRHPVREYLDSLEWDGVPRIEQWLQAYMGVEDSRYSRAVGRIVLVAAVRRVRQPGCKFDEMLILEGSQGSLKSSALAALAVKEEWFSDDIPLGHDTKELMEATSGKWLVEAADLHKMNRSDVEILKAYLSRAVDRARMAYGRLTTEVPRHFIIIGTTNRERYLRDDTGHRRYWPVRTGEVDIDELKRDRDMLWAEASHREAAGESIRLGRDLYTEAAYQQEARRIEDPFLHKLSDVLGEREGVIPASEAWMVVGVLPGQRTQSHNERLGQAMRELGWIRTKRRENKDTPPRWCYVKGEKGPTFVVTLDHEGRARLVEKDEIRF